MLSPPAKDSPLHVGKALLASIHDVGPRFESQIDQLADRLSALLDGPRFSMLVVPDHWGEAPLHGAPAFCGRLRAWADQGVEMFVHGWFHRDGSVHKGMAGWKASRMTAGEGEFLGLSYAEATQRMRDGKDLIEQVIGREVTGFIAPAWLYGPEARRALAESGFRLAEDHFRVWRPADAKIVARGPVITWASRSQGRIRSSLAFARLARHSLHGLVRVRIGVHPGDTTVPALLNSIDKTVSAFARRRPAGRYADLCPQMTRLP
jgi:predicted deacetylase